MSMIRRCVKVAATGSVVLGVASNVALAEGERKRGIYDPPQESKPEIEWVQEESCMEPGIKVVREWIWNRVDGAKETVQIIKAKTGIDDLSIPDTSLKLPDLESFETEIKDNFANNTWDKRAIAIKAAPAGLGLLTLLATRRAPMWKKVIYTTTITGTSTIVCYPSVRHVISDAVDKASDGQFSQGVAKLDKIVDRADAAVGDLPRPPRASAIKEFVLSIPTKLKETFEGKIDGIVDKALEKGREIVQDAPSKEDEEVIAALTTTKSTTQEEKEGVSEVPSEQKEESPTEEDFGQSNSADRDTYSSRRQ